MKITVVGAGAMGGALAAEAQQAGYDVQVLDVSQQIVDAINADGLSVRVDADELVVEMPAHVRADEIGESDIVVVFVKAQHTEAAAKSLKPLIGRQTVVVSLQNGWGNTEVLAHHIDPSRVVFGVTYNSCSLLGPGSVAHTGRGVTIVGPYQGDRLDDAQRVAEMLTTAGWAGQASADVRTEIWKKLILNAATLPTAALTGLPAGILAADPAMHDLVDAVALEACAVAKALGLAIDPTERIERIHAVLAAAGPGKASMLQDAEGRRKTEIEVINAAVVRAAAEYGIDVPVNRALVALIAGLERSWAL